MHRLLYGWLGQIAWRAALTVGLLGLILACNAAIEDPSAPGKAVKGTPTATPSPASASSPVASPSPFPTLTPTSTPTPWPTATTRPSPTHTPTPSPTPEPSPTPSVAVWHQEIILQTYGWHQALVETTAGDAIYPYPRLDFDALGPPAPRAYRAVIIQNEYVRLTVVPELGGRILRWEDRTTGRQLFYANPVIKPARWGYRGWWLATGGMEWAFPVEEHGLNEYRPWEYELLWNGVRVWDTDDRTGLRVELTIRLEEQSSAFSLTPRITNPTGAPQGYQFWANAMLTLSERNRPSPALTFILPDDAVTIHSRGDGSLPGPGDSLAWPIHDGRDFSHYSEYDEHLGFFADPAEAGFVGAYDLMNDQGIVRAFPPQIARGVKLFCLGDLSPEAWTDDGSRYFELWGGVTPTFWDEDVLAPGEVVSWTEYWYSVAGIGGYNWANRELAIRLLPAGETAELAVASARPMTVEVVLRRGGEPVARWPATVSPGTPFVAHGGPASGGDWGVWVFEGAEAIAQFGP